MLPRYAAAMLLSATAPTFAQVFSYEGYSFPEESGWERVGTFDAERWLDSGWLHQHCALGIWGPEIGQTDLYQRPLQDLAGSPTFFVEWRVETDVPSALFDVAGIATAVSVFGTTGVNYHFTITDERVRLIRDNRLPFVFVDITRGQPHSYRLELYADELYAWFVDDQLVDAGVPEGAFPGTDSQIIWGARYNLYENNTQWDYVRYGVIPEPATAVLVLLGGFVVCSRRGGPR